MIDYVTLRGITKRFGMVDALHDLSLSVRQSSFVTLLGPSGCGKSTLLRCIAGLESPDAGDIAVNGEVLFSSTGNVNVPTHRRHLSMVFQSYALWPHLRVDANVSYPLRVMGVSRAESARRVRDALDLVGLGELGRRYPHQLSGGQQQRVAVARAIAYNSNLLLLDEPLSNLDQKLRDRSRVEIRRLQQRLGLTVIYVTHSQTEALTMSDRIAVMDGGRVHQFATPTELYDAPADDFVAGFVGAANLLTGQVSTGDNGTSVLTVGDMRLPLTDAAVTAGSDVRAILRPEDLRLRPAADHDNVVPEPGDVLLPGVLTNIEYLGSSAICDVEISGSTTLRVSIGKRQYTGVRVGAETVVVLDPRDIHLIPGRDTTHHQPDSVTDMATTNGDGA